MTDETNAIIDPSQFNFDDFLGQATPAQSQNFITLPRLVLVIEDNRKFIQLGAKVGEWSLIGSDNTVENLGPVIKFWNIGYIGGRTVWPYDPRTGKKDTSNSTPLCGANHDDAPRSQYVNEVLFDWRTKEEVKITDSCKDCPLKNWEYEDEVDYKGNPVVDHNGKPKQKRLAPVCQETPNLLWYVEGVGPVRIQVSGTQWIYVKGVTKGKYGKINGLNFFFNNPETPLISRETRQMKWLEAHPFTDTNGQKPVVVPKFSPAAEPMALEEMAKLQTTLNKAKAEDWIGIMKMEWKVAGEEEEEGSNEPQGEVTSPF